MGSYVWPNDDGWPYPDSDSDDGAVGVVDEVDIDTLAVRVDARHLLDGLDPLERRMVAGRYGIGEPPRSMKQLHHELGLPRDDLRVALGSGLAKLRTSLGE